MPCSVTSLALAGTAENENELEMTSPWPATFRNPRTRYPYDRHPPDGLEGAVILVSSGVFRNLWDMVVRISSFPS